MDIRVIHLSFMQAIYMVFYRKEGKVNYALTLTHLRRSLRICCLLRLPC
ncbi:uncharacterized protein FPRO_16119 [Fusarium proliferatum ET1]|uniref:Uncharacterized protein n=1 Tax=Fusarium proliferatum (strain ET1) TaxID=1227346 RepID=A0A1L7WBC5_FUSPR|nr:uncharacterized protein FPRO_16119 [Fusarium proliferatum ET1]CZR49914.1 uncharacterized protein FPRO_16119 [Fusarium proliferatum ET1]